MAQQKQIRILFLFQNLKDLSFKCLVTVKGRSSSRQLSKQILWKKSSEKRSKLSRMIELSQSFFQSSDCFCLWYLDYCSSTLMSQESIFIIMLLPISSCGLLLRNQGSGVRQKRVKMKRKTNLIPVNLMMLKMRHRGKKLRGSRLESRRIGLPLSTDLWQIDKGP